MGSNRTKPDAMTLRAQKAGYPARSVYKLEELQNRLSLIKKGDHVLDIGAAPGSWSLFVSRNIIGKTGTLTAVDLKPLGISSLPASIQFIQGDAFCEPTASLISAQGPYDVILSDAAPATTGNRTVDTARSEDIAEAVLALSDTLLKPQGNILIKVFQGGGEAVLMKKMRERFGKVKPCKPKASRDDSFEVFLAGIEKKQTT